VVENQGKIKPLAIDSGSGCVEPSFETIGNGTYSPLSRPLYLYVAVKDAGRPEIVDFINYMLGSEFTPLIQSPQVGYVKLQDELYAAIAKRFADGITGTLGAVTLDKYLPGAESSNSSKDAGVDYAALSGDVVIDGSSTVFPVTSAAAEEFSAKASKVRVSVGVSGTGGGFKRFCNGETAISNASRPIKESEAEICKQNGVEFIELPVAYDGLSVVVSPSNDFVQCMTIAELNTMWAPEAQGTVTKWSQIRAGFPDNNLVLLGAGTDSGTFDYFTEAVNGEAQASRGDYLATEDDNVTITGVAGDKYAIGYLGYAYVVENQGKIKPLAIDSGSGCVEPSFETIGNGTYSPLSRPLYIYVAVKDAGRPEIVAFVNYMLGSEFTPLIQSPQVGYVKLQDELYAAIAKRFADGITGTLGAVTLDNYLK
jgi:phosphate binding protein